MLKDLVVQESACGCAGIYSSPVALPLYAHAFEQVGHIDRLEAFTSFYGADFYGIPRNKEKITLVKEAWTVPEAFEFGEQVVLPMFASQRLDWVVRCS